MLKGIKFLDSIGLFHQEINPPNILLSTSGSVKIGNLRYCKKKAPEQSGLEIGGAKHISHLAMQMMDRNIFLVADLTGDPPTLGHPERWSLQAKDFITIASSSRSGSDIDNASTAITFGIHIALLQPLN